MSNRFSEGIRRIAFIAEREPSGRRATHLSKSSYSRSRLRLTAFEAAVSSFAWSAVTPVPERAAA
eukprot:5632551-Pleurochrysis_carterae.AAC.1